jgi:cytoskeletal protein CcmA (bactofilin family)
MFMSVLAFVVAPGDTFRGDVRLSGEDVVIHGVVQGDLEVMGGDVMVNGRVTGDVELVGGDLYVAGVVEGDVDLVGGDVELAEGARIGGDVNLVGGDVDLGPDARVEHDVSVVGGTVRRDSTSRIGGSVESLRIPVVRGVTRAVLGLMKGMMATAEGDSAALELPDMDSLMEELKKEVPGEVDTASMDSIWQSYRRAFRKKHLPPIFPWMWVGGEAFPGIPPSLISFFKGVFLTLTWMIFGWLVLLIFPHGVDRGRETLRQRFWESVGWGTLGLILILPVMLLLVLSILGIPLIPLYVVALFLVWILGYTLVADWLGELLERRLGWKLPSRYLRLIPGVFLLFFPLWFSPLLPPPLKGVVTLTGLVVDALVFTLALGVALQTRFMVRPATS